MDKHPEIIPVHPEVAADGILVAFFDEDFSQDSAIFFG
jgi:hypothetical protein